MNKSEIARKNFLYYNTFDLILCCLLPLLGVVFSSFFPVGRETPQAAFYSALAGIVLISVVVLCYSVAAVDNKFSLLLLVPLKLVLAGFLLTLGLVALASSAAALDKENSKSERLEHAALGAASAAATAFVFRFIKTRVKH